MSKEIKTCVYCRVRPGITDDHVPPKNLFLSPLPSTLLTVPACHECNHEFSTHDEYFRYSLVCRKELSTNPVVHQLGMKVLVDLDRPEKTGFLNYLLNRTRAVPDLENDAAKRKMQTSIDHDRVDIVIKRIVKGLHFKEFGRPLSDVPMVICDSFGVFDSESSITATLPLSTILSALRQEIPRVICPDVFEYQYSLTDGAPEMTTWLLTFYTRAWYLVFANGERFFGTKQ